MSETTEFDPPIFRLFVPGEPSPGGSKRAIPKKNGKIAIIDDAKNNRDWKATVRDFATQAWGDQPLLDGALSVVATFYTLRPKGHYGAKGLKPSAPPFPLKKPDATKLFRAAEDALTGVVWRDDCLITDQNVRKRYGDKPGVAIEIRYTKGPT